LDSEEEEEEEEKEQQQKSQILLCGTVHNHDEAKALKTTWRLQAADRKRVSACSRHRTPGPAQTAALT
jgi:hypothetical protein